MEHTITGYKLREALKQWNLRATTLHGQFNGTLQRFEDEEKITPLAITEQVLAAEAAIAKLQEVQEMYNLRVQVKFENGTHSLSEAVKLLGGFTRVEKSWKTAAKDDSDPYSGFGRPSVKDKEKAYQVDTVSKDERLKLALQFAKRTSALRSAIAVANGTEVVVDAPPGFADLLA